MDGGPGEGREPLHICRGPWRLLPLPPSRPLHHVTCPGHRVRSVEALERWDILSDGWELWAHHRVNRFG